MSEYINRFTRETEVMLRVGHSQINKFFLFSSINLSTDLSLYLTGSKQSPPGIFKFSTKATEELKVIRGLGFQVVRRI